VSIALVLPPLTQLNTPYPSISYLARFLRDQGIRASQRDLGMEWMLRVLSAEGLSEVFAALDAQEELPPDAWRALALRDRHLACVDSAVAFLQGHARELGPRILRGWLPEGPRLARANLEDFGPMGTDDAARHLATLYIEDLADLVTSCIDEGFGLARYQHHLAVAAESFDPLYERLQRDTLLDGWLEEMAFDAELVCISVPFPGNLYGALRLGRAFKARGATVLLGGGFISTELRDVDEPRLWEFTDGLVYDDGEGPLLSWIEWMRGEGDTRHRTRVPEGLLSAEVPRPPMTPAAWYGNLDRTLYLDLVDTLNPAHRLWADGRWSKVTVAHGCYWKRCSFCDVNLDYISHFEQASTTDLVDAMEQDGGPGFHLVDEAAPPAALKSLALELIRRDLPFSWWGNIRFERAFTPDLCRLLAHAGMVAVTGGLEVASNRLLEKMDKGVTVEQVARAAAAFRGAGVMVHAYLMYGFPSQTDQETVDSMEVVRQLFQAGLLNSAFWHRFVLTRASRVVLDPQSYGIQVMDPKGFAGNDLQHIDHLGGEHDRFDTLLPKVLSEWMRGRDLQRPMAGTTEAPDRIRGALTEPHDRGDRLVWIGGEPLWSDEMVLHTRAGEVSIPGTEDELDWLAQVLEAATAQNVLKLGQVVPVFPGDFEGFAERWAAVRRAGLLLV
jgi:hypothetical protein